MIEFLQIPERNYHADTRIGHTTLRKFAEGRPAARELSDDPNEVMVTGKASHIALLEPHRVKEFYVSKYATICKSTQKEREENPGRLVVTQDQMDEAVELAEAVELTPSTWSLLKQVTHRESTLHWTDPRTGLGCKCRPDAIIEPAKIALDVKTARDFETFNRDYLRDGYLCGVQTPGYAVSQGGHYLTPLGDDWKFGILLAVKEPAIEAGVIWISQPSIVHGRAWCSDMLVELQACRAGKIPWSSPWSRWPQEFDRDDGLQFVHEQLTKGGEPVRGIR